MLILYFLGVFAPLRESLGFSQRRTEMRFSRRRGERREKTEKEVGFFGGETTSLDGMPHFRAAFDRSHLPVCVLASWRETTSSRATMPRAKRRSHREQCPGEDSNLRPTV